jgi:hypothetical protein
MSFASCSAGLGSRPRRGRVAAVLVAAAAAGLGACGDQDSGERAGGDETAGVGHVRANSTAQFASCRDWRRGTEAERYATIEDIRGQLTPQSSETAESPYPDEAAYAMFEKVCATGYSDSFRLYKLYARAQAYAPLRTDLDDPE